MESRPCRDTWVGGHGGHTKVTLTDGYCTRITHRTITVLLPTPKRPAQGHQHLKPVWSRWALSTSLSPAGRSNPRRPRNERAGLILSPAVPRGRDVPELVPTSPRLRRLLNGSQSPSGPVSPKTLCQSRHPGSGRWDGRTRRRAATRPGSGEERARIPLCSVPGGGPLAPGVCRRDAASPLPGVCCRDAASPLRGPAQGLFIQLAGHQTWGRRVAKSTHSWLPGP